MQKLDAASGRGGLTALCGIVGCSKTSLLERLRAALKQEGEVLVSRSLAVDEVNLKTLITALFYDLTGVEEVEVPVQAQRREHRLLSLIG